VDLFLADNSWDKTLEQLNESFEIQISVSEKKKHVTQ
jgi:hypothetical protein